MPLHTEKAGSCYEIDTKHCMVDIKLIYKRPQHGDTSRHPDPQVEVGCPCHYLCDLDISYWLSSSGVLSGSRKGQLGTVWRGSTCIAGLAVTHTHKWCREGPEKRT